MKWIVATFAAFAFMILSLSVPTSILTTEAYASKMNGKPYGAHARNRRAACFEGACRRAEKR